MKKMNLIANVFLIMFACFIVYGLVTDVPNTAIYVKSVSN